VVTLDDHSYTLRFFWNPQEGFWYAHLLDEQGATAFKGGQKVIPFTPATIGLLDGLPFAKILGIIRRLSLFPRGSGGPTGAGWDGFPGILFCYSAKSLPRVQDDIKDFGLFYADADFTADALATAIGNAAAGASA
jgi:hypothetical protein